MTRFFITTNEENKEESYLKILSKEEKTRGRASP
jgi:hypothetical protein